MDLIIKDSELDLPYTQPKIEPKMSTGIEITSSVFNASCRLVLIIRFISQKSNQHTSNKTAPLSQYLFCFILLGINIP